MYCPWPIDSRCSSNSMNIVIWIFWGICLQDIVHILKVDTSRNNICCKENPMLFLKKSLNNFLSFSSFELSMNSVNFLFFLKVEIHHFRIVINTCTGAQKDNNFGTAHFLLYKVYQKMHFFYPIFHHKICISQTFRNDVTFCTFYRFLILRRCSINSFESYFCQVSHSKEIEIFLLHTL